jgi:hypothetical protein
MKLDQYQWSPSGGWNRPLPSGNPAAAAQIVFLFGSAELVDASDCVALVRRSFPNAHLFGCSTSDVICGTQVGEETLALTAVAFEHSRVATAHVRIEGADRSFAAGEQLARLLDPDGLRHLVVLSEGLRVNGSDLLSGLNAALPPGVTVSGGFAADGYRLRTTHVWCDGAPEQAAAVALGFYGDRLHIGMAVTGGWGPFGPDRLITKSRQNVLYSFDGRPALALYKQYLGDYAAGLPASGLAFPLELRLGRSQHRLLRVLLAVDEQEQSITFAGNVPEGSYARFMMGHIEDLITGSFKAARTSLDRLQGRPAQFSLLVSCNARRAVLKQRVEEEVEAVREGLDEATVLTGFYSYGEIGPPDGGTNSELHNETLMITSFAEG